MKQGKATLCTIDYYDRRDCKHLSKVITKVLVEGEGEGVNISACPFVLSQVKLMLGNVEDRRKYFLVFFPNIQEVQLEVT